MEEFNLFSEDKLEKINLSEITGGESNGYETDTWDCTEKNFGCGQGAGDTTRDGDWISTC